MIVVIKTLIRDLPCDLKYAHAFDHLNDVLQWDETSTLQKMNVLCGSFAKCALIDQYNMELVQRVLLAEKRCCKSVQITLSGSW